MVPPQKSDMIMRTNRFPTLLPIAAACLTLLIGCGSHEAANHQDAKLQPELWPERDFTFSQQSDDHAFVRQLLNRMTTEEKVGQILQAEIQTITPEELKQYHIGSLLNGGGSLPNRNSLASAADWARFADRYYQASVETSGGRAAIPVIWGTDAVHGHNNLRGATIFPHNIGLGAANDAALMQRIGEVTAQEVRASGIEWVFAPTLAVARNDKWGRTYESYSESPERVAQLAGAMIVGLQGQPGTSEFLDESHVAATAKHFLADGGTQGGDDQGNAVIDEATLVAVHNAGYPVALDAGAQTVMASFSSWNGQKMHGNHYLLTDILKDRMKLDGFVVGDWNGHGQVPGCTNDSCPESIEAGIDMAMVPYDWKSMFHKTLAQVNSGVLSMARLDDAVSRILLVKKRLGLFDGKAPSERALGGKESLIGNDSHREVAREAVRKSLVLLKNNQSVLPIAADARILVAGSHGDDIGNQSGGWSVSWQGTGNTNDNFPRATSIYQGLRQAATYPERVSFSADGSYQQKPDVAIVVFGEEPYAEGQGDIDTLEFQPHNKTALALLHSLKADGIPVVSVFISGRPLWVNPEINASDAFVAAWLPGTEGAGIADVLLQKPSGGVHYDFTGTLSFSWPKTPQDAELNVGQTDYDPLFAFGYGLTYQDQSMLSLLPEQVAGLAADQGEHINFYQGRPLQPWYVAIKNDARDQLLSGAFAKLPEGIGHGSVWIQTTDKEVQEDALTLSFQDAWFASIFFGGGKPLDLSQMMAKGTVSFDIRLDDMVKNALDLNMSCGAGCDSTVRLREWMQQQEQKKWLHLAIPLACFDKEGADFSAVEKPFNLIAGGSGQLSIANIRYSADESPNFTCVDRTTLSTTPSILNEHWAEDWWMPRHEEKLAQRSKATELLMIGDSITHNWEKDGEPVWQKYFSTYQVINMGFGGDRTENVLWRLDHGAVDGIQPKLAVIMIGTNNTGARMDPPQEIYEGIEAIVERLQQKLPNTHIALFAIFPRGENDDDALRQNNQAVNAMLPELAKRKNVEFVDINRQFLKSDGTLSHDIMPDLLHPNAEGYEIWAKKLKTLFNTYLQ